MSQIQDRKKDHIKIVLEKDVEPVSNPFNKYRLPHKAFPEVDFDEIDTSVEFLGKKLSFPFIISSMTGGEENGLKINTNLSKAAEEVKVGLGLGSMRVILRKPESLSTFDIRKHCPSIPLFANFGVVQLNYGYSAEDINKIIKSVDADGIFIHVNHLQEIIQPEGDKNWKGLLKRLGEELPNIDGTVIVKETGHGIEKESAEKLKQIGVNWIDVSGAGGTSWGMVEAYRRTDDLGFLFQAEGTPTDEAILEAKEIGGINIIAGGGIRSGIDIAKAIALGADLATAAKPLLEPALTSSEECVKTLNKLWLELKVAMFVVGVKNIRELKQIKLTQV